MFVQQFAWSAWKCVAKLFTSTECEWEEGEGFTDVELYGARPSGLAMPIELSSFGSI